MGITMSMGYGVVSVGCGVEIDAVVPMAAVVGMTMAVKEPEPDMANTRLLELRERRT